MSSIQKNSSPKRSSRPWLLAAIGCLLLMQACAQNNLPDFTEVSGQVTFKGEPLSNGAITFIPAGTGGSSSASLIDSDGRYELRYSRSVKGIAPGEYQVRLESQKLDESGREIGTAIPRKFESPNTSGLTAVVEKGTRQTIDFDLAD